MILPIFALILTLVLGAGLVWFQRNSQIYNANIKSNVVVEPKPESSPTASSICPQTDSVDYSYYDAGDALWPQNNKFGLYVYAERGDFITLAKKLVNSSGGSWGYVLLPYNVKDRDSQKWKNVFEQLHKNHLIPVVQLWDVDLQNYKSQTKEAAQFLNSLLWPIRYKYVSVYNEPNDAKFWYGKVDPETYAKVLAYTITAFRAENEDFFMLNGALNVSSSTDKSNLDAFDYMKRMNSEVPGVFNELDGWASHSYPQPNFSGNPHTVGRYGIRAYDTELSFLKNSLGVKKELPVFITETGWAHAEGSSYNNSYLSDEQVAENFKIAYEKYWLPDARVRAVMPFTIWYDTPFDHFSWVNNDEVSYKHYDVVKSIKKVAGKPPALLESTFMVTSCDK